MIRDLMTLQDRMNRLFQEAFPTSPHRAHGEEQDALAAGDFLPPVDIYEDDNAITLKADIPGIDPNKIDIRIEGNRLFLRGDRSIEQETKRENFYRMERSYGTFSRTFALPQNIQADKIEANYRNGVLELRLPKREESKARQIKVQSAQGQGKDQEIKVSK